MFLFNMDSGNERIAQGLSSLNTTLVEASQADIKARDRVDISLSEYEALKDENRELKRMVDQLSDVLKMIDFPIEILRKVRPETIEKSYSDDHIRFRTRYRIEFDVDRF